MNSRRNTRVSIRLALLFFSCFCLVLTTTQTDQLQSEIDEFHEDISEAEGYDVKKEVKEYDADLEKLYRIFQSQIGVCTKKQLFFSSWKKKEYLKAFAEGDCSPVILIAGYTGSKLIAEIDCKVLKQKSPELFETCGWDACRRSIGKIKIPKKEYVIWFPKVLSPMSIIKVTSKSRKCFEGIIGFRYTKTERSGAVKLQFKSPEGVRVKVMGDTPGSNSRKESGCGMDAIRNLGPTTAAFQTKAGQYFRNLIFGLQKVGYKTGLTMQALPVDWRRKVSGDPNRLKLKNILKEMFEMTGKKVTIVTHSMGSFYALDLFWSLNQSEKDQMVASWIAVAPPLVGSVVAMETMLGASNNYMVKLGPLEFGISPKTIQNVMTYFQGSAQLAVKRFFRLHMNEPWMAALIERMKQEILFQNSGKVPHPLPKYLQGVMGLFPSLAQRCTPGFEERKEACLTGVKFLWDSGSIQGKRINPDTFKDLLDLYSVKKDHSDVFEDSQDRRYDIMKNTGVQVNIIYSAMLKTREKVYYYSDPRQKTFKGKAYPPDREEHDFGDGTVLAASSIGPGIKWADEFRRGVRGSKPVNFIEICSQFKQRKSIFDDRTKLSVKENAYFGIKCGCRSPFKWKKDDGSDCEHNKMMTDPFLVEFIVKSSKVKRKGRVGRSFLRMSNWQLKEYVNKCKLYHQN